MDTFVRLGWYIGQKGFAIFEEMRDPVRELFAIALGFTMLFAGCYVAAVHKWDELIWHSCWIMIVGGGFSIAVEADGLLERLEINKDLKQLLRRQLEDYVRAGLGIMIIMIATVYTFLFHSYVGLP